MAGKGEVKITLSADSRRLNREMTRAGKTIRGFSRGATRMLGGVGRTLRRSFGGVRGLFTGYGFYRAGKHVLDYNKRLFRLAAQARGGRKEAFALEEQLDAISKITHQKPGDLLSGVEAVVERTGNLKFAVESLKDIGTVATASGAAMEGLGATASNLQEKMDVKPTEILKVFDVLASQGKMGAFTLQNMAQFFERLLSAATMIGVKGISGIRKFGAFLQFAQRGTGVPERTATAVESVISSIIENADKLPKEMMFELDEKGVERFRDFDLILKDIVAKTVEMGEKKGSAARLKLFGREGVRAINPLVESFKKFGNTFEEFDKFVEVGGKGTEIMKDFRLMSSVAATKAEDLGTRMEQLLRKILDEKRVEKFAGAIDKLIDVIDELNRRSAKEIIGEYMLGPKKPIESYKLGAVALPRYNPIWERSPLLQDLFDKPEPTVTQPEHTINLEVNINQESGQVTTKSNDMRTKINLNRGKQ